MEQKQLTRNRSYFVTLRKLSAFFRILYLLFAKQPEVKMHEMIQEHINSRVISDLASEMHLHCASEKDFHGVETHNGCVDQNMSATLPRKAQSQSKTNLMRCFWYLKNCC